MTETWQNLEIQPGDLPAVEDGNFQHHPIRYRKYRNLGATLFWAVPVLVYSGFVIFQFGVWAYFVGALLAVFMLFSFFGINIGYRRRSYALRERDLTYKKGWLFYATTTVPFNRIQHTEVSQGPLERRYELCTLNIYTAGGSTSDLSIPGLNEDEAQQLRDFIAKKAALYA